MVPWLGLRCVIAIFSLTFYGLEAKCLGIEFGTERQGAKRLINVGCFKH